MSDDPHAGRSRPARTDYPANWETDVVLRDGRPCHVRPIHTDDGAALQTFYDGLSEQSLYTRFFTASAELAARDVERLTQIDYSRRVALLATLRGQIIGMGVYDAAEGAEAEIAFTVADAHQGRGLGSVLLEHLAAIARENGIHRFKAEVLSVNKNMLATFTSAGYSPSQTVNEGVVNLDFDIDPTAKTRLISRAREHRAEALCVRKMASPQHVVVMCDDISQGSPGEMVVANLVAASFVGRLWVVNPSGVGVHGVPGRVTLADVRDEVDMVVMALPPDQAEAAVPRCAEVGVLGIVFVTGGYRAGEGLERQPEIISAIRESGMRIIGPSSLGLINTDPRVRLNASLVPQMPGRGRIGLFCQSAAFGAALLREVANRGLGLSMFVSVGDRADVSTNDFLQFWEDDDATSLVLLHTESIGNPRKFIRITRRLALRIPVVALRSGGSTQVLPISRTVRRTELPAMAVDDMFEQAGVIQVDSLTELLDLACLLAFQPLPGGPRVAFVSDSDPLGLLAVETSDALGLEPVRDFRVVDPLGDTSDHEALIAQALADPAVDVVVIVHAPSVLESPKPLRDAAVRQASNSTKPIVMIVLAQASGPISANDTAYGMPSHGSVPVFSNVESALRAVSSAVDYVQWVAGPRGTAPKFGDVEPRRADVVVSAALDSAAHPDDSTPLSEAQLGEILASYGIDLWPSIPVTSEEDAAAKAKELGYPVVLKSDTEPLVHRSDLGGVRLKLENEASLRTAYLSMAATLPPEAAHDLQIQRMAPPGVACFAATQEDPLFGPVVSFRIGGMVPELLEDYAFRIPPLTNEDARALVRGPQASPLLLGGQEGDVVVGPPVDLAALEDLLIRLGQLADHLPEVSRLELNPIIAHPRGVAVLRATGSVARPQIRTDLEVRRLL